MPTLFAGLDVSDSTTSICVMKQGGDVVVETTVHTKASEIAKVLRPYRRMLSAVGQESGTMARFLDIELKRHKLPMVCLDARHTHAALAANPNKTDKGDAWGIAAVLARGLYSTSHLKSDQAQQARLLLKFRKIMLRKAYDLQRCVAMSAKIYGARLQTTGRALSVVRDGGRADHFLVALADPVLRARGAIMEEVSRLDDLVQRFANDDPVCRRLMTIPGVGPIAALTFRAAVDDPTRFTSSRTVAAYFGLTPRTYQSGLTEVRGRISKRGDAAVRVALYDAACVLLSVSKSTWSLRTWGLRMVEARGYKFAAIAVARKLAVTMHRMWVTGTDFTDTSAGSCAESSMTQRHKRYQAFWHALIAYVKHDPEFSTSSPPKVQCWSLPVGRTGFSITLQASERGKWISAEVIAHADRDKAIFDALIAQKLAIEEECAMCLAWERQDGKVSSRIAVRYVGADPQDVDQWPTLFEWYAVHVKKLRACFTPRISELSVPTLRPVNPAKSSYRRLTMTEP